MEDLIPTIVVLAVMFVIYRWFFKSSTGASGSNSEIRGVTRGMVDTVHAAFPDIPISNIIYSLSRTRSAQTTSEDILERGFLPAPPASFSIPASLLPDQPPAQPTSAAAATTKAGPNGKKSQTLIERYNLATRLPSHKGKERDVGEGVGGAEVGDASSARTSAVESGGATGSIGAGEKKLGWEDTKEKREVGLRERKERMILEARKRLLEKQEKAAQAS